MTSVDLPAFLRRPLAVDEVVAVLLTVLLGSRFSVGGIDAPVGALLGLALFPVWLPLLGRFRLLSWSILTLLVAAVSGLLLSSAFDPTHQIVTAGLVSRTAVVAGLIGGFGLLMYVGTRLGPAALAIAYGAGMLLGAVIDDPSSANAWRFTYSIPLTVLILGALSLTRKAWPQVVALLGLAAVGVLNDARSNSAMLVLAAVVIAWQAVRQSLAGKRRRRTGNLLGVLLFALALAQVAQASILEGYFGEATRDRTEAQLQASGGSLILGGRPEAAASLALISRYPFGFGSGTKATLDDMTAASQSMISIGYDPDNNYVRLFLFGGPVELHSVLGDFWLWFGLAGALACLLMLIVVGRGLDASLREHVLTGLFAYLAIRFGWDLLFSPALSASRTWTLTVPLAALAVAATRRIDRSPRVHAPTAMLAARRSR